MIQFFSVAKIHFTHVHGRNTYSTAYRQEKQGSTKEQSQPDIFLLLGLNRRYIFIGQKTIENIKKQSGNEQNKEESENICCPVGTGQRIFRRFEIE